MTQTIQPTPGQPRGGTSAPISTLWALGDYASVATEVIACLGSELVEACRIDASDTVLDVAAGAGNAAIEAARRGADVVASDLTPELLEIGRLRNPEAGPIRWEVGNAEDLPNPDASFDVVMSCVGVMFAPHHQQAADELVRVLKPGGRLGLIAWTPAGVIGQMFALMKPYAPPPPPGAAPPPLWGGRSARPRAVRRSAQRRALRAEAAARQSIPGRG